MISYYELLKRIEKGDIPEKIKVHLTSKPRVYKADYDGSDFSHYFIYDGETDGDYHHYLAECFLESDMFDKNIEILEEDKKIEKMSKFYTEHINENGEMTEIFNKHELAIIKKINEIIDKLNEVSE